MLVDGGTEDSTVDLAFGHVLIPGAVKLIQGEHTGTTSVALGASKLEIGSLQVDLKGATNNVTFGSTTDVLLVKGALTVNGGAGADSFTLGGSSVSTGAVKFTAGDGSNTFQVDPSLGSLQAASVTYTGGIKTDTITFEGVEVRIKGAFNLDLGGGVFPNFDPNFVTVDAGSFTAGSVRVSAGEGGPDGTTSYPNGLKWIWRYQQTRGGERQYKIVWKDGLYIETLSLSKDGTTLDGTNKNGEALRAVRVNGAQKNHAL